MMQKLIWKLYPAIRQSPTTLQNLLLRITVRQMRIIQMQIMQQLKVREAISRICTYSLLQIKTEKQLSD